MKLDEQTRRSERFAVATHLLTLLALMCVGSTIWTCDMWLPAKIGDTLLLGVFAGGELGCLMDHARGEPHDPEY